MSKKYVNQNILLQNRKQFLGWKCAQNTDENSRAKITRITIGKIKILQHNVALSLSASNEPLHTENQASRAGWRQINIL